MMATIVVIGGKLQGTEALFLAREAGLHSVLLDKNPAALGRNLACEFICLDVLSAGWQLLELLINADMVLPALENDEVLAYLHELAKRHPINLAFDYDAYRITASKLASDCLFKDHGIPAPRYYPDCRFPCIVKPSNASGSHGVRLAASEAELAAMLNGEHDLVVQEYLAGKAYSVEIIGRPGQYQTYQITEIIVDQSFDCKRVLAPVPIKAAVRQELAALGKKTARLLQLNGIMDLEVIDHNGVLKVLEADARFPSQTPICVYYASGVNYITELLALFGKAGAPLPPKAPRQVCLEQIEVIGGRLRFQGEHIIAALGPLQAYKNLLGADLVLTDRAVNTGYFCATVVNSGAGENGLQKKRRRFLGNLRKLIASDPLAKAGSD